MDKIEPGALDEADEPVVLLVKQASGDEEIGAAGVNLRGVILCHGLPHLSHLGKHVIEVCCFHSMCLKRPFRDVLTHMRSHDKLPGSNN